ncbi:MarR family winged helix-turn-helix transcriptional regulator [Candidatus Poriferisocius sp.]|uniref:MarR family winged helix-turn-helix transcriptional regulator n=1 Tax=Candidatus Poriferisocius sp. TaxID=3101276 RepID=UPI003B5C2CFC
MDPGPQPARDVIGAQLILLVEDFKQRHEQHMSASNAGRIRFRYGKVMFHLDQDYGTRLVDLAKLNGVRIQSMAELVDDMEAQGLVVREPDPDDGRAKRIRYTDAGRALLNESTAASLAIWDDWAAVIGVDRLESLQRSLADLTDYRAGSTALAESPEELS